jgi:prepilin-type N-terminal cleavage/methylation domain-containing protein
MKNRPGLSLIEVMIAVMVFSFAITAFAALYPLAARQRVKSEYVTRAATIAQRKVEQIRALPYSSLNYTSLRGANVIDASPTASPYSFTTIDTLAGKLPQATGTVTLANAGSGSNTSDLKRIDVTVTWGGAVANGNTVTVSTTIANKEARLR